MGTMSFPKLFLRGSRLPTTQLGSFLSSLDYFQTRYASSGSPAMLTARRKSKHRPRQHVNPLRDTFQEVKDFSFLHNCFPEDRELHLDIG